MVARLLSRRFSRRTLRLFLTYVGIALIIPSLLFTSEVAAITQGDINCQQLGGVVCFYEPSSASQCIGASSAISTTGIGATIGSVSFTSQQIANAKIIMGIAKTENLGEKGALIGVATSIDESTLTILANSNVPVSESNPAKQGNGSNGDSVGIFQQQPNDGWSTYATGPSALTDKNAVWQDMVPAAAAEFFFGSPPGAKLPSGLANPGALTKGLQNISNWQSQAPQVAAQQVQNQGAANSGNVGYQNAVARAIPLAQDLLNKYWNSAAAVPLPIPFTGGTVSGGGQGTGGCTSSVNCTSSVVGVGSGAVSQLQQNIVCLAQQELQLWQSGQMKPGTDAYFKYTQGRNEEWCADFASWIYNQAGYPLGPAGSASGGWDVPFVGNLYVPPQSSSKFTYHSLGSGYTPKPGDLALHGTQHVNIVVAVKGSTLTLIGGDQGGNSFQTNTVSEYSTSDPSSDIPPITGFLSPN